MIEFRGGFAPGKKREPGGDSKGRAAAARVPNGSARDSVRIDAQTGPPKSRRVSSAARVFERMNELNKDR
jgi:hypothetical protein